MSFRWRYLPETFALLVALWVQFRLGQWLIESEALRRSPRLRALVRMGVIVACLWLFFGLEASSYYVAPRLPAWGWLVWVRAAAFLWMIVSFLLYLAAFVWRRLKTFNPKRRRFLLVARGVLFGAPLATLGYGVFVERGRVRVREVAMPVPGLHKDLDGLRLVQVSDIHLSPFLSERELERVVDMANQTRARVALVTGDFITMQGDPLEACLQQLARLRAEAGIYGCLGNHEGYAGVEDEATVLSAGLGIQILRGESRRLQFGAAAINLYGVDYQSTRQPYLVGARESVVPGDLNLLLSHNPDVFEVAAAQGWNLTLAGHTHGGQIAVEILDQNLSAARFYTPYVYGVYRRGASSIYVNAGVGTVGLPVRLGAPPEIAVIQLCAI
jgi:uncharacterized protein